MTWQWAKGAATSLTDIGNPLTGLAHYSLCVYDASGAQQPLVSAAAVAQAMCGPKACWKATGKKGFQYKDRLGHTSGTQQLKLTAGAAGKAKALYKGRGPLLGVAGLPPILPLTVQLIVNEQDRRACWEAAYSTFTVSDAGSFKAKSD